MTNPTERCQVLADLQQESKVAQMAKSYELRVEEWSSKFKNPQVYSSGHMDEHGAEGFVLITDDQGGLLITYLWDAESEVRRWTILQRLEKE